MRGIHDEHCSLACGKASRHFIREVDVTRRVNQVELIGFAIVGRVVHPHRLGLDRYAPLTLDIHRIEKLLLHVALRHRARLLENTVAQR